MNGNKFITHHHPSPHHPFHPPLYTIQSIPTIDPVSTSRTSSPLDLTTNKRSVLETWIQKTHLFKIVRSQALSGSAQQLIWLCLGKQYMSQFMTVNQVLNEAAVTMGGAGD